MGARSFGCGEVRRQIDAPVHGWIGVEQSVCGLTTKFRRAVRRRLERRVRFMR